MQILPLNRDGSPEQNVGGENRRAHSVVVPEVFMAGMLSSPGNYRTHIGTGECLAKIG